MQFLLRTRHLTPTGAAAPQLGTIDVEPQVLDLLIYLVENRDRVVTKDDLIASGLGEADRIGCDPDQPSLRRAQGDRRYRPRPKSSPLRARPALRRHDAHAITPAANRRPVPPLRLWLAHGRPGRTWRGPPASHRRASFNNMSEIEQEHFSDGSARTSSPRFPSCAGSS
jgi:hypothetical protein